MSAKPAFWKTDEEGNISVHVGLLLYLNYQFAEPGDDSETTQWQLLLQAVQLCP